ncbi:hypothetical protein [Nocardia fusca]|uniref:hypothetical protein n=1 Tax=Nocardia fusca TaxID=941183 RepID=UPI000A4B3F07|nr:hypothetical protein [Nocardia fusca]
MDSSAVAAAAGVATALIALVATVLVVWQVVEMRKTTYASAFKAVYDMLQDESLCQDCRFVMRHLRIREFASWSDEDIQRAERVCHSYDCVGIMCRRGFIPTDVVADSWGRFAAHVLECRAAPRGEVPCGSQRTGAVGRLPVARPARRGDQAPGIRRPLTRRRPADPRSGLRG